MTITKTTIVIIEHTADYFLVKCGTCGGDGRYSGTTCHVCDGAGKVFLKVPPQLQDKDFGLLKCGTCGGDGRYSGTTCHVCNGVGVLVKCFPRLCCGTCGGNGRYSGTTCHVCDGAGSVYVGDIKKY